MRILSVSTCGECPVVRFLKKENGRTVCQHPNVMHTKPYNTQRIVFEDQTPPDWCPLPLKNTMLEMIKSEELI